MLPSFDKQADIPKGFEAEYEEKDGKWVPIDHAGKLKKALDEERGKRETTEKALAKAAKDAADAAAKVQAQAAGMTEEQLKKLYGQVEENLRKEYEPKLKEAETLASENRGMKLTSVVKEMFRNGGGLKSKLDDLWKLHGDEFDLTSDGKPMVKAEPGKDVAKHVAAILKSRAEWTQGTRAVGGGALNATPNLNTQTAPGSGADGALTFDDLIKNPAGAVAEANAKAQ